MAKTIGLALGSGGARGWAHVGVIRALQEADIKIDYLAGTSIGALVGAFYATDALDALEKISNDISTNKLLSLMDISFPSLGLIRGEQVYNFLAQFLTDKTIEGTAIPYQCVATNFLLNKEVVFQSGKMVDAVRASISIPGIFAPFKRDGVYLVDGGIVNPVPVSIVKAMGAEVVIAVNLNHDSRAEKSSPETPPHSSAEGDRIEMEDETDERRQEQQQQESPLVKNLVNRYDSLKSILQNEVDDWIPDPETGLNIFDVIGNSMNAMEQKVTQINLQIDQPTVLIQPDLVDFGVFDFHQSKPMMQKGYDTAKAMMPQIQEALSSSQEHQSQDAKQ